MRGRVARSARRAHNTIGGEALVRLPATGKSRKSTVSMALPHNSSTTYLEVRGAFSGVRGGKGASREAAGVRVPEDGGSNPPPATGGDKNGEADVY